MTATHHRFLTGTALLSTALVWLVSVTLCSTRVFAEAPHEHPASNGHSDHAQHSHGPAHEQSGKPQDDGCGCESFKAFPAKIADSSKVSAPATALLFTLLEISDLTFSQKSPVLRVQNTGPPETESFAERFLQQCLLSQAPPVVA